MSFVTRERGPPELPEGRSRALGWPASNQKETELEIFRNLARRKVRSTLTISGIVIGIFALTTMGAMANHFNALIDGGVVYFGSHIQVGEGSQGVGGASVLPISKVDEIKRVDGVAAAFPSVGANAKPGAVST